MIKLIRKIGPYVLVVALLLAGYIIFWGPGYNYDDLRATVYSSKRSGYMMFNSYAQRIGADIRILGRSLDDENANLDAAAQLWLIAPERAQMLPIGPEIPPAQDNSAENITLKQWVSDGGILVLAPGYAFPDLAEYLIAETGFSLKTIEVPTPEDGKIHFALAPESADGLLSNVTEVISFLKLPSKGDGSIFRLTGEAEGSQTLLADDYGPAAVTVKVGKGTVLLIADPYIFSNFLLPRSDNSQFAANILAMANGKPVYFDEFHHGYEQHRTFTDVLKTSSGRGVAFLLAVALLAIYASGRRFGQPLPAPLPGRRSPAEYVVSMGFLFRRAGASDLALDVIERDFANFLMRRFHLRTTKPSEVDAQLKLMAYSERKEIVDILEEFEKLHKYSRPPAKSLLKLSRRIDPLKGVHE